jgi:hypothetical protein
VKFEPEVGDVGVIGHVKILSDCALVRSGLFDAMVTANGYDSVAQNIRGAGLRLECPVVPDGVNDGDKVTADILQGNDAAYAANITKL